MLPTVPQNTELLALYTQKSPLFPNNPVLSAEMYNMSIPGLSACWLVVFVGQCENWLTAYGNIMLLFQYISL